jgi:uncharacterized RDD family membrane protein YckC
MTQGGISPVPREARPYQGRRAGFVTRAAAATIDGIVVGIALLVGYLTFAVLLFLVDPRGFEFPEVGLFFSLFSAFWTLVIYFTMSWWLSGRSYGCLVMGLRVVGPRNRALRLPGAFLRALFCAVFPIGLLWVAVSRDNRSVQDTVLRTSVLYDWQPRGEKSPPGSQPEGESG